MATRPQEKWAYSFGPGGAEGSEKLRDLLGGKGAGLAEMARAGARVPPGFTLTTEACKAYLSRPGKTLFSAVPGLRVQFDSALKRLEKAAGRRLGDRDDPLLLSVRSGAKFSMPGMMDTVLNIGLNSACIAGLAKASGDPRFAWDCRRRLIQMYGNVVRGIEKAKFEEILSEVVRSSGKSNERELDESGLRELVERYLAAYRRATGEAFPEDPRFQLESAAQAVFHSWGNPRAIAYRKANRIPEDLGTACSVQAMAFGNRGEGSGTGVGFTRSPATGADELYGEYLPHAQGEDVVAGVRTPQPISRLSEENPKAYRELVRVTGRLERRYRDAQDFEFTIQDRVLYMLQTRTAKRTALAALRMAVEMAREGLISRREAVLRMSPDALDQLLKPVFDAQARSAVPAIGTGLPAGPGAASGRIVFSAEEAVREAARGPVILVRPETNPDDIQGIMVAQGILTATGGLTSHAAVVGRGLGKVCVVGCGGLTFQDGTASLGGRTLRDGDTISLDGFTGEVLPGQLPTQASEILRALRGEIDRRGSAMFGLYETLMGWADGFRRLGVRANADRPEDVRIARLLGAEGVGLCRTEHMFFGDERIGRMVAMIVAESPEERSRALEALFPLQKEDFKGILREMGPLPVIVRTLDPPLHEYLPHDLEEARRLGALSGIAPERLWAASRRLKEVNPMLGHRGCRVGITHPEITRMQAKALFAAARELQAEGMRVRPEVMIPLVGFAAELADQRGLVEAVARDVLPGRRISIGTMVEVPRAVWTAGEIAAAADFFSFGTNDLTQMTLGYSRDDYGKFMPAYRERGLLPADPFQTIDAAGVGEAVRYAVQSGRRAKPKLEIGVCGEHGGDPDSIAFFHRAGLDYVSCSPYRVPAARLAAAQAALRSTESGFKDA